MQRQTNARYAEGVVDMELQEFQNIVNDIRAKNGWIITIEFNGIYSIDIEDKESGQIIAYTGSTSLYGIVEALKKPLDECPWV